MLGGVLKPPPGASVYWKHLAVAVRGSVSVLRITIVYPMRHTHPFIAYALPLPQDHSKPSIKLSTLIYYYYLTVPGTNCVTRPTRIITVLVGGARAAAQRTSISAKRVADTVFPYVRIPKNSRAKKSYVRRNDPGPAPHNTV